MAGLKEIRNRIASVKSTRQITSAMKMVSASKLKKAQDKVVQIRPYADKLKELLLELSANFDPSAGIVSPFIQPKEPENVLIVLLASNRGLCGGFNANVCKKAIQHVEENYSEQLKEKRVKFLTIGKKAGDFINKNGYDLIDSKDELFNELTYENVAKFAESLMQYFINGDFDRIDIVYNRFKNAAIHFQVVEQFLPMALAKSDDIVSYDYIFEPSANEIMADMIPKSLKVQLYKSVIDSNAAEHGARMTSMHQATDNASELIKDLTLVYNKARQTSITNEILEITSGAEAQK